MTEIIEAIDDFTSTRYAALSKKLYGFCELARETAGNGDVEQVISMTIPSSPSTPRTRVSLDDRYNLITWIRWPEPVTYEDTDEFSFGKSEARVGTLGLRVIFANKTILGEDLVFDFVNALPSKFTVSGFNFVHVDQSPTVDPDHDAIYRAELGDTAYEKHRFTWNLYAVNITVQFLECRELTP